MDGETYMTIFGKPRPQIKNRNLRFAFKRRRAAIGLFAAFSVIGFLIFVYANSTAIFQNRNEWPARADNTTDENVLALKRTWSARIDQVGVQRAYEEFRNLLTRKGFQAQHFEIHFFGALLYDKFGINGFTACEPSFDFGCFHGFIAAAIVDKGLNTLPAFDNVCRSEVGPRAISCQHGIGHGIADYMGPAKLIEALDACEAIPSIHPLINCGLGVFMGYSGLAAVTTLRKFNPNHPYDPCPSLPEKFQMVCYYSLPIWWDTVLSKNYGKMGTLCGAISDPQKREVCFRGVGIIAAPVANYDVANTIRSCRAMPTRHWEAICRAAAAEAFYAEPSYRPLATSLCNDLEGTAKQECMIKAGADPKDR